jgi:hypothetical protein
MIISDFYRKGWKHAGELSGIQQASIVGKQYIDSIMAEIDALSDQLNSHLGSTQSNAVLEGFAAEEWHAGTFNIKAAAANSFERAAAVKSTEHASADIKTPFGGYSLKYYGNPDASAKAQAKNVLQGYYEYLSGAKTRGIEKPMDLGEYLSRYGYTCDLETLLTSVYNGQGRIIPADQLNEGIKKLRRMIAAEAARGGDSRLANMRNYEETLRQLTDRISNGDGVESIPLSKKEAEAIAALCKDGNFKPEDFGLTLDSIVTSQYILNQALRGGMTAGALTLAIQLAPMVISLIRKFIVNGAIDVNEVKRDGLKCVSSGVKSFMLGFFSCGIYTACRAGKIAPSLVSVSAPVIGTIAAFSMEILDACFNVAMGTISLDESRSRLTKGLIVSCASLIGGTIAAALIPAACGIAFAVGSMIGSVAASIITDIGEKIIVSLCVNTGYTLFGIVKQDYSLPVEVLRRMGISITEVDRIQVSYTEVERRCVERNTVSYNTVSRTGTVMLRRGVIAFHKVGYVQ